MKTYKQLWMKKYTPVLIIVLLVLTAILYGIRNDRSNGKGGNILADASPDTSAFQMHYFDGGAVAVRTLYDRDKERKLIKKISAVPPLETEKSALSQMDIPFCEFRSSNKDGRNISMAASGSIWLRNDGTVYDGDTELSLLWEQTESNDEDDTLNVLDFPNAGRLSACHSIFLLKADEQAEEDPEGLTVTAEGIGTSEITVRATNKGGEDFSYGGYFSLQRQIDGQWYAVPVRADSISFQDIANIPPNGEGASETYNLGTYGMLEPRVYGLVVETPGIEFLVGHGRMAGIEGELAIEPRKTPFI